MSMSVHEPLNMRASSYECNINEMLRHLSAQRECATRLIQNQNKLLSQLIDVDKAHAATVTIQDSVDCSPPSSSRRPSGRGNVISLLDYRNTPQRPNVIEPSPRIDYHVVKENDPETVAQWGDDIKVLLEKYGADDALAINRKYQANTLFMTSRKDGLFYFKAQSGVLFVICFVGSSQAYWGALCELKIYAESNNLQINIMAMEDRVNDLKYNGFSTTPIGVWQRIDPLSEFTLNGSSMRRLRYMVSKYSRLGNCRTIEYSPGSQAEVDEAICTVIDQWVDLKAQIIPYITAVKEMVRSGNISADHRFFLTYRGDSLDNVIVFSRDNFNDGYLMDLEFYSKDVPHGSTEYALNEIIECFKSEGRRLISLGLTLGTELFEHENASKDVVTFFAQLKKADYLNGDANAQYKSKYRPKTSPMYLARPEGSGKKNLNDLIMLLGSAN